MLAPSRATVAMSPPPMPPAPIPPILTRSLGAITRAAQHVSRNDHEIQGETAGCGEERTTREIGPLARRFDLTGHGCSFISR